MANTLMGNVGRWNIYACPVTTVAGVQKEIIAASTGFRIRVLGCHLAGNVSGSVKIESASTALTGDVPISATGGYVLPMVPFHEAPWGGWMDTAASAALNVTSTTATAHGIIVAAVET